MVRTGSVLSAIISVLAFHFRFSIMNGVFEGGWKPVAGFQVPTRRFSVLGITLFHCRIHQEDILSCRASFNSSFSEMPMNPTSDIGLSRYVESVLVFAAIILLGILWEYSHKSEILRELPLPSVVNHGKCVIIQKFRLSLHWRHPLKLKMDYSLMFGDNDSPI